MLGWPISDVKSQRWAWHPPTSELAPPEPWGQETHWEGQAAPPPHMGPCQLFAGGVAQLPGVHPGVPVSGRFLHPSYKYQPQPHVPQQLTAFFQQICQNKPTWGSVIGSFLVSWGHWKPRLDFTADSNAQATKLCQGRKQLWDDLRDGTLKLPIIYLVDDSDKQFYCPKPWGKTCGTNQAMLKKPEDQINTKQIEQRTQYQTWIFLPNRHRI